MRPFIRMEKRNGVIRREQALHEGSEDAGRLQEIYVRYKVTGNCQEDKLWYILEGRYKYFGEDQENPTLWYRCQLYSGISGNQWGQQMSSVSIPTMTTRLNCIQRRG